MLMSTGRAWRQEHRIRLGGARAVVILVGSFDLGVIVSTLVVVTRPEGVPLNSSRELPAFFVVLGIAATWMLMLTLHGGYVALGVRGSRATVRSVALGSLAAAALVAAASWTVGLPVPRTSLALGFALGASLLVVSRWASCAFVRHLWANGRLERRVVVIGEPTPVGDVSSVLMREERLSGLHVAGACVHAGSGPSTADSGSVRVLRGVGDVVVTCREADADAALVAASWGSAAEMRRLSWALADHDIDLFIAPDATEIGGVRMELLPTAGLPLLHVDKPRVAQAGGIAKRLLDIALSSAAVILLAPVVLVVVIFIKLEDHGPVYFRQTRIGRRGRPFTLLKFRTMETDAERRLDELRQLNEADGPLFKLQDDPRVTRVGKHLRCWSLDELPQLFNVIRGEMSLVGPRPPLPSEVGCYEQDVHRRLLVRPGLTGLWQISGRSTQTWADAVRLDLYYVDNWSMGEDLRIMAQTAKAVLSRRGAC